MVVHIITIGDFDATTTECLCQLFLFLKPVRSEWLGRTGGRLSRLEEIRIAQAVDLIGPKLIWLAAERNLDNPDGQLGDETGGDCGAGATPRVVAVKQQRDMLEVILEKHLLPLRKRASH
jgi:hypothetical protein